jgi:hypothetical protein
MPRARSALLLLALLCAIAPATRSSTHIDVSDEPIRSDVRRFGIGLAQHNYYDSGQMMKELLFRNPGFEGLLFQSALRLRATNGATPPAAVPDGQAIDDGNASVTAWRSGFWNGATYEIIWSAGANKGRTGTVLSSVAPSSAPPSSRDPLGDSAGTTFQLGDGSFRTSPGDYIVLRKTHVGGTGGGAATGSWEVTESGGGTVTSELADLPPPPDTGFNPPPPIAPNQQCVRLTALAPAQQARVVGRFNTTAPGFILFKGRYRVAFEGKGVGGANRVQVSVKRGNTPHLDTLVTLSDTWTARELVFPPEGQPALNEDESTTGSITVEFSAVNQSAVLLDNVSLRQTDSGPANPTEFRDDVVAALAALRPGILRYVNWQDVGNSLDNALAPVFTRKRSAYNVGGETENNLMPGLHEFFVLCKHLGSEPWYSIPVTFSNQEIANLMEYLGGSIETPYGKLRAARGHPQPWTEVFPRFHFEFGNENWNPGYRGAALAIGTSPVASGQRATELFNLIKSSPHKGAAAYQCIVGGQTANYVTNLALHNASSAHDALALAPYLSNRLDTWYSGPTAQLDSDLLFGALFAEPHWWSINPTSNGQGLFTSAFMRVNRDQLLASSRPVPLVVYEVNLHTTEWDSASPQEVISQEALDAYTPSLGAGLAVMNHMLIMLRELGVADQCFFSLVGHRTTFRPTPPNPENISRSVALWGAALDMGRTNRKRPHYHALQLVNEALGGELVRTTHGGDDTRWSVNNVNRVTFTGVPHLQSFAFREGSRRAVLVFNLSRSAALDVTFGGPNAPAGPVTLRRLASGAVTDGNENAPVLAPVEIALADLDPGQPMTLPPFSLSLLSWTPPPRHAWRHARFGTVAATGDAADNADPDGDGWRNLLEYALGADLGASGGAGATPSVVTGWHEENGLRYLMLDATKDAAATDVALGAEVSADLINWSAGEAHVTILENTPTRLRVRDNTPSSPAAPRRFIRLHATVR